MRGIIYLPLFRLFFPPIFYLSAFYRIVDKRIETMTGNLFWGSDVFKALHKRYPTIKMSILWGWLFRLLLFPFISIHKMLLYSAIPVSMEDGIP